MQQVPPTFQNDPVLLYGILVLSITIIGVLVGVLYRIINKRIDNVKTNISKVSTDTGNQIKELETKVDKRIDELTKKVDETKEISNQIKFNYIDRFNNMHESLSDMKEAVLSAVNDVKLKISEEYVKAKIFDDCIKEIKESITDLRKLVTKE